MPCWVLLSPSAAHKNFRNCNQIYCPFHCQFWLRFWRIMCFPSLIIELIWWLGHQPFDEFHEHAKFWFIILLSDTDTARRFWHFVAEMSAGSSIQEWQKTDSSLNINCKLKQFVNAYQYVHEEQEQSWQLQILTEGASHRICNAFILSWKFRLGQLYRNICWNVTNDNAIP